MSAFSFRGVPRVKLLCALVASCFAAEGLANPTGPAVVSGSAAFNSVGKTLTVTNSPNAIINWQGFSIGAGEATRFQQQSAASSVLNRIVGQDPSVILGTLWSNGRVFLVNPNGVLFGQGSRVDVAGLVASTLNITDQDFLTGKLNFQAGALAGSIVNQGEITTTNGGRIYLIAPDVQNHGLISSPGGEVLLAAGKTVSLVDADVPNLKVEVQAGGEALNVGKILADGGKAGIYAGLINQRGVVRADSVSKDATGRIVFKASDTTILDDASVTSASGARGGEIQVLGSKVGLIGSAKVDASGDAGGGTILIGGDYQGKNADVQNAWRTYMSPQSSITADAITTGDGGKVIVWSDDATRAYGTISAHGGSQSGNGGFVEVSGKNWLDFDARVDTSAPKGSTGVLLLDPAAVNITNTLDVGGSFNGGNPNIFSPGVLPSTLTWTTIKNHLTGAGGGSNTNVYVTTSGCSIPGSCGIDILAASPDLAASNTLRLISHEAINVNGSITNTGSGALEMYAGWNGSSPVTAPILSNFAGSIAINQPITFTGNVLLRAFFGITDAAGATITTPNLLASASSSSVSLSSATHMVGTLAGTFHNDFSFKNGQTLTIGSVDGVNGISTVASPGGAPTLQLTVMTGNLVVNSPITVTDGGGTTAPTSITLTTFNGGISVNNTTVSATGTIDDSGNGNPATVAFNVEGGGIGISNGTVSALGGAGSGSGDPGGSATVTLNATGGITANSSSTISATGGAPGFDTFSGANGGDANIQLVAGGPIDLSASTLTATKGSPLVGSFGTAGVGTVSIAVNSSSGNASPSGDITVDNVTADNVNIQQESLGVAKSIVRASGTSLITANQLLMEMDDPANVGGGSIGTSAAPMRVQVAKLESHTHEASPGIFIDSPNAGNLQIGGVSFFGGVVKGVQNVTSGDIKIGVNGTLTLQSGTPNSPCGTGTGGPICTTSGNVTLLAEDMAINHTVAGTGSVLIGPYTVSRNINIESSPTGGVLSLTPAEVQNVTAPTLLIGRTDGTGTLTLSTPLEIGAYGAFTLAHGNVNFSGNITKSSGTDAGLSLIANNSIQSSGGADITSTSNKLNVVLNSDADASSVGRISLGTGTVITSNGGNVTLGGGLNPLSGNAFGDGPSGGAQHGVHLDGAQIIAGAGNVSIRGQGAPGTDSASGVRLFNSAVVSTTTGSITMTGTGGAGALGGFNRGILALAGTVISSVDGTITLSGVGGSSTGTGGSTASDGGNRGVVIADGAVVSTTGTGNIVLTGTGGTSVDVGSNSGVLITQSSALGTGVTTVNGNITITGTGGTTTGSFTAGANRGVSISSGEVRSTGTGSISITGTGGTSVNNSPLGTNSGVLLQGDANNVVETFVTTAGGNLSITGTAGSNSGTGGGHEGISIVNNATAQSGGTGTLTLTGTAAAGNSAIEINAGGGFANPAHARAEAGGALNVTANGGLLKLVGATASGGGEFADLGSIGNQTINAAGIVVIGGASGGVANNGNYAEIGSEGTQTIAVGSGGITITGGGGGANFARIGAQGNQSITVNGGDVSVVGNAGLAQILSLANQTLTLQGASSANALTIGSAASANTSSVSGSNQSITAGQSGQLGSITVLGGTTAGRNAGIFNSSGTQTISTSGTLSLTGGTATGTASGPGTCNPNLGSGSCANVSNNGTGLQTVSAKTINITGGNAGVSSGAGIFVNGGPQQITVGTGGLHMTGGNGGTDNFATIGGSGAAGQTLTLNLSGDAVLDASNATLNSGVLIGVGGNADAPSVTVNLTSTGDLSLKGSNIANAGAGIGSGAFVTNATTTLNISARNVTLTGGSQSIVGARIGHPNAVNGNGPGDISITATGALALNDSGTMGAAIRTLGNVTLNAASITEAANSIIAAGTLTTVSSGSQTLNGANAVASLNATTGGGSLSFTNATTLSVLGAATSGGAVNITVNSGDLNIPGQINAGAGAVTLLAPTGAVNGTGTSPDIIGGTLNITAGNIIGAGGLHLSVPQINSLVATAGQIDVQSFTTTTLQNAQASGAIALNSSFPLTIAGPVVSGSNQLTINSPALSFAGNVSLTNYTFGSSTTLQSGTLNLAGTTTIPVGTTVAVQGGTFNASSGTVNVAGTMQTTSGAVSASTLNLNGLFDASGGAVSVGTLNVLTGGTLKGTGTITGNVNNSAGTVSPGASPGILTITGNYTQGPSGTLDMQIGGLVAGSDYDQLRVGGSTSLSGTLNTALINGFIPVQGTTFTLIQSTGPITGTFTTVNQPIGTLFDSFYGLTTFDFVAGASSGGSVPVEILPPFQNVIVSTDQVLTSLIQTTTTTSDTGLKFVPGGNIDVAPAPDATTTTADGKIIPKPPACN